MEARHTGTGGDEGIRIWAMGTNLVGPAGVGRAAEGGRHAMSWTSCRFVSRS